MNTVIQYPLIPENILSFLLDKAGEAGESSPRRSMPAASLPNKRQAEELYEARITAAPKINAPLTPKFAHVAQVILNPVSNLTLRAWGGEESAIETNLQFPGYIREGEGVALNRIENSYKVSAFFTDRDIVKLLDKLIPNLVDLDSSLAFEAQLPIAALSTLFAILDLYRMVEYPSPPYSTAEISGYIDGKWGLSGFDALLTYMLAMGQTAVPPSQIEIDASLSMLVNMGVLQKDQEDNYTVLPKLLPLVSAISGVLSGLQWKHMRLDDHGEVILTDRLWLYGSDGLVLMLTPSGNDMVYVSSIDIKEMKEFLIDDLLSGDFSDEKRDRAEKPVDSEHLDAVVNNVEKDQMKENRHKPVQSTESSIQNPGKEVRYCPECGTELLPEAKFCIKCGARVST